MTSFSGSGRPSYEQWLEDFEANAEAVGWDELQRFIYAKQLLKGGAKIFIRSQSGIISWCSLKHALQQEFGVALSSVEVHRALRNRRKHQGEDLREYLYVLMEIGKPIKLDNASLIDYFIEGIPDTRSNKSNLYQAKTIQELKEQIKVYEKIQANKPQTSSNAKSSSNKVPPSSTTKVRGCFNCGDTAHIARNCRRRRPTCFKCGKEGHKAADCRVPQNPFKAERNNVNTMSDDLPLPNSGKSSNLIFKEINFNGVIASALIDTGCDLCLMRYDTLMMLNLDVDLDNERRRLVGIGTSELTTLGSFTVYLIIDDVQLKITFHVAREKDIKYALVIGNNVLKQVDLIVTEDGAKFRKKEEKQSEMQVDKSFLAVNRSHGTAEESVTVDGRFGTRVQAGAKRRVDATAELQRQTQGHKASVAKGAEKAGVVVAKPRACVRGRKAAEVEAVGVIAPNTANRDRVGARKTNRVDELAAEFEELCLVADLGEVLADDVDLAHLNKKHEESVRKMIAEYKPIKNTKSPVEMKILLLDDAPVYERPRRMSHSDRQTVDNQVKQWLEVGIIQPSTSDYASPVVLVKKKTAAVDYAATIGS